jgi:hypothetical protein
VGIGASFIIQVWLLALISFTPTAITPEVILAIVIPIKVICDPVATALLAPPKSPTLVRALAAVLPPLKVMFLNVFAIIIL